MKWSINLARIAGLVAAVGSALVYATNGDYVAAAGLVGAALSAAGLKGQANVSDAK